MKCEPILDVWGLCPQRSPVAESLTRWSGDEASLELKAFKHTDIQSKAKIASSIIVIANS